MPDVFTALDLGNGKWRRGWVSSGATAVDTVSGGLSDTVGTGFSKLIELTRLDQSAVLIVRQRYKEGYRFVKVGGAANGTFRVALSVTSGSSTNTGTKTTAVNFQYDVTSLAGVLIGTSKTPEWPSRSENGKKVAAIAGLAYYDNSGTLQIAIAFEKAGTGGC